MKIRNYILLYEKNVSGRKYIRFLKKLIKNELEQAENALLLNMKMHRIFIVLVNFFKNNIYLHRHF